MIYLSAQSPGKQPKVNLNLLFRQVQTRREQEDTSIQLNVTVARPFFPTNRADADKNTDSKIFVLGGGIQTDAWT